MAERTPQREPPAQEIALEQITYRYGGTLAVDGLTLTIRPGELFGLLGPSGCGKTTTLRLIAGFIRPDGGIVRLGARDVTSLPPERRHIGMVFQNYALFPHMSVFDNVAFGLVARAVTRRERTHRVAEVLALVQMEGMERRPVADLSGGQQQRVALARALVIEPSVLLLDEPLSNLDARLREQTGAELRSLQQRLGITTVYVTHDQSEALALCDRIAVMRAGRWEQIGTPEELFLRPRTSYVADFLGRANFLPVDELHRSPEGWTASVGAYRLVGTSPLPASRIAGLAIRPHALAIAPPDAPPPRLPNTVEAIIRGRRFLGADIELALSIGPHSVTALLRPSDRSADAAVGAMVLVHLPPDALIPVTE